jgi:hypothetical protein
MSLKCPSKGSSCKPSMATINSHISHGSSRLESMKQLKTEYRGRVKYNDNKLLAARFKIERVTDGVVQAAQGVSEELNKQLALYLGTKKEAERCGPMVRYHARMGSAVMLITRYQVRYVAAIFDAVRAKKEGTFHRQTIKTANTTIMSDVPSSTCVVQILQHLTTRTRAVTGTSNTRLRCGS